MEDWQVRDGRGEVAFGKCHSLWCYQHKDQRQTPNLTWLSWLVAYWLGFCSETVSAQSWDTGKKDKHSHTKMSSLRPWYTHETHIHACTMEDDHCLSPHFGGNLLPCHTRTTACHLQFATDKNLTTVPTLSSAFSFYCCKHLYVCAYGTCFLLGSLFCRRKCADQGHPSVLKASGYLTNNVARGLPGWIYPTAKSYETYRTQSWQVWQCSGMQCYS